MCGRFVSISSPEGLAERFAVDDVRTGPLEPRYNVAPSTEVYAIIERRQRRRLGRLQWGFVPPWTRRLRGSRRPINAKLETVASSRMFATSFARRRCLIPADGYYEWQDRGQGRAKQPYHLHDPDDVPLALAGVWTTWRDPDADADTDPLFTTAIVTTGATDVIADIHDRMPLVLPASLWTDWLMADEDRAPHLLDVLAELDPPALRATPVSDLVNSVANDGPELLEPATVA